MALINGEVPSDIESLPISIQDIKQLLAQCWALEPRERPSALNCLDVLNTAVHASQMDGQVASAEVQHDSLRQDLLNGAIPGATRSPGSGALTLADPGGDPSLASTSSSAGDGLPRTPGTDRRTLSLEPQERAIITVTADAKNYPTVDITGAESAAIVRKRIFSTLQIPEDDQENYQIYRTELGEGTFGDPLTDEWLMIYCGASADAEGTLKFIVQRNQATIKWVKGELIGKNTYSRVFLAFNVITGEMMAVKQVELPQNIKDQDDVRQVSGIMILESEQQTLAKLEHPNIVQYLGFEKTKECLSLFLEYVPGGSIGSCLRASGKFAEDVIKSFTGQIIDGLAYLHANKIIHRNVKADTVLVDASGICKLSDFAISVHTEEMYKNTIMNTMEGSLFWMAPEMLYNDNKGYSAKVDIWSLGCAFIEMFTGRRPWEEDDFVSVLFKVGHNRMAPPVPNDVELSTEAEDFRLKCFNPDSDARPTAEGLKGHPWLTLPPGWVFRGLN